ncbi:unnamed protein product [Cuscuta epithymum]|uniref:Uncharacterized protein n=1 Tax=Cuscuta epithymum TaxID=186058 RepID=A0AAV0DTA9_9ASTE|nr:unnamed protein product [Cuscuta epithymum]
MALKPDPLTRTRNFSACYRHRTQPSTGICAACLRERLSGVDPSADPELSSLPIIPSLLPPVSGDAGRNAGVYGRRNKAGDPSSSFAPDLRRSRSVSGIHLEGSCSSSEPRRVSCDVRDRNTLALLFDTNDCKIGPTAEIEVETESIGCPKLGRVSGEPIKNAEIDREIRVSTPSIPSVNDVDMEEGELKTMKEYIDLEVQSRNQKPKDLRDIAGNLWEAASVLSKKLQKWRQKQNANAKRVSSKTHTAHGLPIIRKSGKQNMENFRETQSDVGENAMGRRSCDTEPRISVENPHIMMMDEPRASWDGYLVARNISGQSNSDSSFSQMETTSDRSSSVLSSVECHHHESTKPERVKLVITEKELKDWHLKSVKDRSIKKLESFPTETPAAVESCNNNNNNNQCLKSTTKKASTWRKKVWNVFGFKKKLGDTNGVNLSAAGESITRFSLDNSVKPNRLTRSCSVVRARNSTDDKIEVIPGRSSVSEGVGYYNANNHNNNNGRFLLSERNRNAKCSSGNLDNGLLPFYLMPLRTSRSKNTSRSMLLNSDCISENVLN